LEWFEGAHINDFPFQSAPTLACIKDISISQTYRRSNTLFGRWFFVWMESVHLQVLWRFLAHTTYP